MKLVILAVGHKQPGWVREGCDEYLKRMPRELPVQMVEIKPEPRGARTRKQLQAAEKERITQSLNTLGETTRRIILDEKGIDLTTRKFSERLKDWMRDGCATAFLIGGADGLDTELKANAQLMMRLSSLTLPHGMARLLLCEQLYRAASLLKNHPYHRE
jgi:23S rRNA (pseudouridine1915-N3)-methyltransferase